MRSRLCWRTVPRRLKCSRRSQGGPMDEKERDGASFATRMAGLERVVSELQEGELSLEEALRAFEEGVGLVRALDAQLNEAEHRIELLTRTEDGMLDLRPAPEDED